MSEFNINPEVFLNAMMLGEQSMAPVVRVLNKYGIYGSKVMTFLLELGAACGQMGGEQS